MNKEFSKTQQNVIEKLFSTLLTIYLAVTKNEHNPLPFHILSFHNSRIDHMA